MFDMTKIGRNIAELRKERNMTQMELADKMEISFQAVSNWERGVSMPDIAKLPELASVLEVTLDHLLGEHSEVLESSAKGKLKQAFEGHEITLSEICAAAPLLKPKQIDEIAEGSETRKLKDIEDLLPFVGTDVVDRIAMKLVEKGEWKDLDIVLPFVSGSCLNDLTERLYESGGVKALEAVAPFLDKGTLLHYIKEYL